MRKFEFFNGRKRYNLNKIFYFILFYFIFNNLLQSTGIYTNMLLQKI